MVYLRGYPTMAMMHERHRCIYIPDEPKEPKFERMPEAEARKRAGEMRRELLEYLKDKK